MGKRVVICCDGTWNSLKQPATTNVVKIAQGVAKRDDQLVHYHEGVGTRPFERVLGGAFGFGLSRNVRDAYRFLVEHYEPGDELFFFGFSRGAYTARSTVGFVRNCGILRRDEIGRVDEAYRLYRDSDPRTHPVATRAAEFRRAYACEEVTPVRFVGVWDTVGALGIPLSGFRFLNRRCQFHDTKLTGTVAAACQALAVDERRGPFRPTIWESDDAPHQLREQTWFVGSHSDVGGGYPDPCLASISLLWMAERARRSGLVFEPDAFAGLEVVEAPVHDSRTSFYKLLRAYERQLGVVDPGHEEVAPEAVARLGSDPSYAPRNLKEFLAKRAEGSGHVGAPGGA
ncbi:uncharacterized protein (DUF2235 family) [Amycolatopsis bartoniae]|uniref:T6SS Phospholipase effector Tle1-like catalytic domain-containing protein n=1 Tax=Amycolatopsis bartoniae TaxID=941986 RepID=A0A8H9J0W2_9PSEU|nr:DUF2235 domain-containing protein [Amycolatopsis bartoniae]MBB2935654.1 uncharacterized protein (DUF2235 family) [Amycolatopsis bartoniae]TVT02331.1 DUF2235 domain-containing protein [Amycolatopsis bartoniae]GHF60882.1 hypothetical protein GCM10017566_37820 [Amycolatopsis bartoniae]